MMNRLFTTSGGVLEGFPLVARLTTRALAVSAAILVLMPSATTAQSLKGSAASMDKQVRVANQHQYTRLKTHSQVMQFVNSGYLVRVPGNADYELSGVSYAYARPEVKLFIERLASQYHSATGEKLVVTSLTRPQSRQPRNASQVSVHTTGMAIDLRKPRSSKARKWLESTLLSLEGRNVVEATMERRPPHYHVAVFPEQYSNYVEKKTGSRFMLDAEAPTEAKAAPSVAPVDIRTTDSAPLVAGSDYLTYKVSRGDSLWAIAQRFNTSVTRIKSLNGMRTSKITAGQTLVVPGEAR